MEPAGATDRVSTLGGCPNFRHLGGYRAAGGRRTRADRLYRTGWLQLAGDDEVARFRALQIRRVFDFRSDFERDRQRLALPGLDDTGLVSLPIAHGSMADHLRALAEGSPIAADMRGAMSMLYAEMLREGRHHFSAVLHAAAASGEGLLIACTLGKDRTGVASALLLAALGVDKTDILHDYMISAEVYDGRAQALYDSLGFSSRIPLRAVQDMLTVRPEYLEAAWSEMERTSGEVSLFLRDQLSVSDDMRARLIEHYTLP